MENKKKHEFLVGIPTINRADLLNEVLPKYYEDFYKNDIFIIDNGNQNIIEREEKFHLLKPNENLGVAKSWNKIIEKGIELGYQRVLILNDDVYLGKHRKDVEALIEKLYHADIIHSTKNFCAFVISTFAYQMYGKFDENFFPAYFEDKDYMYRLKIEGGYCIESEELDPEVYRNSMTIKKDIELNNDFGLNEKRYISKWGGLPNEEIFKTPYDEKKN